MSLKTRTIHPFLLRCEVKSRLTPNIFFDKFNSVKILLKPLSSKSKAKKILTSLSILCRTVLNTIDTMQRYNEDISNGAPLKIWRRHTLQQPRQQSLFIGLTQHLYKSKRLTPQNVDRMNAIRHVSTVFLTLSLPCRDKP